LYRSDVFLVDQIILFLVDQTCEKGDS